MLIKTRIKIGKENKILEIKNNEYIIMLKAKPIGGEANKELIKFMKKYFKKNIIIKQGHRSRDKILEILE